MAAIRAILFDLDDTLIDDDASYALTLWRLCDDFGFEHDRLHPAYDALSPRYWGSGDLSAQREALWQQALSDAGYDPSMAAKIRDHYLALRVETSEALDGTAAVLADLRADYKLAVVTNGGGDIQPARLAHAGLDSHIDLIVTSSDVDVGKPDPRIFEHALVRLEVTADEAWVVGDHLSSDIAGALNIGAIGVWFNPGGIERQPHQPEAHHVIASLSELRTLLP